MLRLVFALVTLATLCIASVPTSAQNFTGSCNAFCRKERCGQGMVGPDCMRRCVEVCKQKNPKAKD
jgi:hypothetical protein